MDARFSLTVLVVVILAVTAGVIAGQSQPRTAAATAPTSTPTPVPTPPPFTVEIAPSPSGQSAGLYVPTTMVISVSLKQKVTWVNISHDAHTVVADNGTFSSDTLGFGQTFTWTPK